MQFSKSICVGKAELDYALEFYLMQDCQTDCFAIPEIIMNFRDPYNCMFVYQEYLETCILDGIQYEVRACWTEFGACFYQVYSDTPFRFYMLIRTDGKELKTVQEYSMAEKLYVITPIDEDDFPECY